MSEVTFEVRIVAAGTGMAVWDHSHTASVIQGFMPPDRRHARSPMVGIVQLDELRTTPNVLRDVIVTIGEDVKAGRYGEFALVVSSEDEATRHVISDIAAARNIAMFVASSPETLKYAVPAGTLTPNDRQTLDLVLQAGGTVTATEFAQAVGIEQTAAGNRLVSLHRKGYLQRVERPHPTGDLFVDPRSLRLSTS